jgi:hypothetical protein
MDFPAVIMNLESIGPAMKILCVSALLIGCPMVNGQTDAVSDVQGLLKLVDRPEGATPVEALGFRIHPLGGGGFDVEAQPDREGRFTLNKVRPGRYSLTFPMPGRIESFTNGAGELAAEGFELSRGGVGPLVLVISMKSADVSVTIHGFPTAHGDVAALLAPADNHLTLRESCYVNRVTGPQTTFRFVPPGNYRIFVFDAEFQRDVAAYAPRFPDFLKNQATSIAVPGSGVTEAAAIYLDGETIKEALRRAGPMDLR